MIKEGEPTPRRGLWLFSLGGSLIAAIALGAALAFGDIVGPIFREVFTIYVLAGLAIFAVAAGAARRLLVGRLGDITTMPKMMIWWVACRLAFFPAVLLLGLGSVLTALIGLEVRYSMIQALVAVVVIFAFTGIAGGAFFNAWLVTKRVAGGKSTFRS